MSSSKLIRSVVPSLQAVDFFCGAGGMSKGLSVSGINVLAGIDIDGDCQKTYESNMPGAAFIKADVTKIQPVDLEERLGLTVDDPKLLMVACSPCQFYSQIRTNKSKSALSAGLLHHFQRFVEHFRPGFVLIENVPRLRKENILAEFTATLQRLGYSTAGEVLNASKFGVPQNRLRYVLIASRLGIKVGLPQPDDGPPPTVQDFLGTQNGFAHITAGHQDSGPFQHSTSALSENNLLRIAMTPPSGGNRSAWSKHPRLQLEAYRERDEIFKDVYGRMAWDRPAPTITTKFLSLSNGRFGHPVEARAISVREGATLQTFPKHFVFHATSLHGLARQIGNAVPPELARRIGVQLVHLAQLQDGNSPVRRKIVDGRVARAKATLETVQAAYNEILKRGRPPTSGAILEITKGSKQTVLRHLKTILSQQQKLSVVTQAVNGSEVLTVLAKLNCDLPSASQNHFGSIAASPTKDTDKLLTEAMASGYVNVLLTRHGLDRLQR